MNVNIFESHTSVNILCDASMFSAWLVFPFILRNSDHRRNVPTSRETCFHILRDGLSVPSCPRTLPFQLALDLDLFYARPFMGKYSRHVLQSQVGNVAQHLLSGCLTRLVTA